MRPGIAIIDRSRVWSIPLLNKSNPQSLCIFGVRTPLIDDYMETCSQLKVKISRAVRVDAEKPRLSDTRMLVRLEDIVQSDLADPFIAAAFSPHRRRELVSLALAKAFEPAQALIDPASVVASTSSTGLGTYINAMSVVGSNSRLGEYVFINRGSNLGHHVLVGDYVSIGPGVTITSNVRIGVAAIIGAGAVILPGVTVGEGAVVSAGTRVAVDVPDNHLAIGYQPVLKPIAKEKKLLYYPDQE